MMASINESELRAAGSSSYSGSYTTRSAPLPGFRVRDRQRLSAPPAVPTPSSHTHTSPAGGSANGANGGGTGGKNGDGMPRSLPLLVGDDGEMDAGAGADGDADGRGQPQQLPHVRGQHALLGVSQMLAALRQHVESARDRARRRALYGSAGGSSSSISGRRRASDSGSVTSLSPLDTHNHSTNNVHALSPAVPGSASNGSLSSLLRAAAEQTLRALSPSNTAGAGPEAAAVQPPSTADAVDAGSSSSPEAWASERARLQRELQQARSEQRFLQEEAAKRDGMLQLLTRGLREVETSQQQWLQEIDTLSKNLDATAGQNKALLEEVGRLRRSLPRRSLSYLLLSFRWGACVPPSRRGKSSCSR
jgi:hypothetical protein